MHEKWSAFLSHALTRSPGQAYPEYTEKENAPRWAHLHSHAVQEVKYVQYFV